jgi:universal stress protein A
MSYQHILAAVALDGHGETVLRRAQAFAQQSGARLSVLHVLEYLPLETGEALMSAPVDLSLQLVQQAEQQLQQLCERCDLPATAGKVVSGNIPREVANAVKELGADLIVIGHHPRQGWLAGLFNHTEENVVQRAPCDVLALAL